MQNKLILTLFVMLLTTFCYLQVSADEIPLAHAISVIKAAEDSLKSAEWECKILFRIHVPDPIAVNLQNVNSFVREDHPLFARYSVLFDLAAKTFVIEGNSRLDCFDGASPRRSSVFAYSYDGKSYASWQRSRGGDIEPDEKEHTDGTISVDANVASNITSFLDTNGAYAGFGTGFPGYLTLQNDGVYEACKLSTVLSEWNKKGFPVFVQELSDNKWAIEAKITIPSGAERVIRLHVLPQTGIVVYFSRVSQHQGEEDEELRIEVDVNNIDENHAVPKAMYIMRPLDNIMDYVTFTSFDKNPSVSKEMFCISFPAGCYVDDYTTKTYYKVGDLIDEHKASENFMERHQLASDESHRISWGNTTRYTFVSLGAILLGIAIYLKYKRRKKIQ
ncbi:MAG: hypothetical protein Q4G68_11020 [Planctomycetia bacterium]|nr:hypothetical protein [Planctomycetia bacterium]